MLYLNPAKKPDNSQPWKVNIAFMEKKHWNGCRQYSQVSQTKSIECDKIVH